MAKDLILILEKHDLYYNTNHILVLLNSGRTFVAALKNAVHLYDRATLKRPQVYPSYTPWV